MSKVYNFSAGPAVLPYEVLLDAQRELADWHGSGMSVMEMSHRGREFMEIIHQAEADLRTLLDIPKKTIKCCFSKAAPPANLRWCQ